MKLEMMASQQESYDKPRQCIEKKRHYSADKGLYNQGYDLPSGHIQLWELDWEEGREQRIGTFELWCWRRLLRVPGTRRRSNQSIFKWNQPWILIERTDAEAEAPVFWSPDANSWLTGKVPDTGKDWGQKKERASEDEMAGWHHWCNGHSGQTSGDGEGQGNLACCSPLGSKESDMTG